MLVMVRRAAPWKAIVFTLGGLAMLLMVAAILFPIFAQAERYSGPGLITEALLLDAKGHPLKYQLVQLYRRGNSRPKGLAITNDKGQLIIDRKKLRVDHVGGFERYGRTTPTGADKRFRPIFWQMTKDGTRPEHDKQPSELQIPWPSDN